MERADKYFPDKHKCYIRNFRRTAQDKKQRREKAAVTKIITPVQFCKKELGVCQKSVSLLLPYSHDRPTAATLCMSKI